MINLLSNVLIVTVFLVLFNEASAIAKTRKIHFLTAKDKPSNNATLEAARNFRFVEKNTKEKSESDSGKENEEFTQDLSLTFQDVEEQAYRICQEFLGPPWANINKSQFKITTITGGNSNAVYRCSLSEDVAVEDPKTPSSVLFRIYGCFQEDKNVVVSEAATFMLLAERGLGPKLYGLFPTGRLEEYIPSRILNSVEDFRSHSTAIAKEMAKIHSLEVPVRKVEDFWHRHMENWLNYVEDKKSLRPKESFECLNMYKEEMAWLTKEIKKINSPVVYCHNDLQGGNILLRQDTPSKDVPGIMLIDFEFGAYNYRGFDLANQLCEWCFEYLTEDFPYFTWEFEKFPSVEEQVEFIRAYLNQHVEEGIIERSAVEPEVDKILEEVRLFSLACHLMWSLWSVQMSFKVNEDYAVLHMEHTKLRTNAYWQFKEKYLNSRAPNGHAETRSLP
ncbi:hypothetical protein JTE90_019272 [Oedothorax gibbosus]|uniref:Choline/ethanolamine kinase n=1 Tax=Oedothorax gibbosus TaxID=931172 RepID=A0AAV6UVM9_9ARAC|nr:hypothetical protein JTE90_019272 [Oedothorax gibbosus]